MGVYFLIIGVFIAIIAYVAIKVITVIAAAIRQKKYVNAIISAVALIGFFAFIYFMAVKMLEYADKVLSEGMH